MSRDPLDELFGPLEPDDDTPADEPTAEPSPAPTEPVVLPPAPGATPMSAPVPAPGAPSAPVPAVQPSAVQLPPAPVAAPMAASKSAPVAAPVSAPVPATVPDTVTAPVSPTAGFDDDWLTSPPVREELPTEPVPAARKRPAAFLPWIIVGGVTVLALIGALIFVMTLNGSSDNGNTKPDTSTEAPGTDTGTPSPSEGTPETSKPETTTPETSKPATSKPPKVDVGETIPMEISFAGISVEASVKLSPNSWFVPSSTTNRVTWESNLMNSFPDSCAAMRSPSTQSPWGIEQDATGKWIVVRPEGTCAAAPDLYNEIWGLMQAVADSAKSLAG